ncbi:phenol hydroxylase subunit [Glaciimonas sp. PCH181]|uniref:phenol hydroxylase subunit n=1 Tax=Glaciimonas sp. PCH181 TaxID=2133943 RepID=UPI000D337D15|nr:phenol hydroxylase subunit [Glaciimonas sp. PCH181]PUA20359.1 phenol hydroxylase [Glaciimonas sp. PCH181]
MTNTQKKSVSALQFDTSRKYVRVCGFRGKQFVEFDFAVGEPELFAELILERWAFEAFCTDNKVTLLLGDELVAPGEQDWAWRLSNATTERFKSEQSTK